MSGSGSGTYRPDEIVHVEPFRMPDMRVFDRWTGFESREVNYRESRRAHLAFTMPERDLVITATLKPADLWALEPRRLTDTTVYSRMPSVPQPIPTPTPTRRAYAAFVDVEGGSKGRSASTGGYGVYGDLDAVHIWSDPDPAGHVFDRWTGRVTDLSDPHARHAILRIRSPGPYVITAHFRSAPAWQPSQRVIEDRQVYFHAPPDPTGLVFFFHGAGGNSAGWVLPRNVEKRLLLRDAVARGYAVVVTESGDRVGRRWSAVQPSEANADIQHVGRLRQLLVSSGQLPAGLTVFGVGMSNGGGFVSRVADALGWQGAAVYAAACRALIAETTQVPIIWLLAENDRRVSNQDAYGCHRRLDARGVVTRLYVNRQSPIYPERFYRIPGVDQDASNAVYDALKTARLLDRLDYQVLPPSESDWRAAIAGLSGVPVGPVLEQLDVCWAGHRSFGDANHLALDFFDRLRGATPTPTPTATATPTATPHREPQAIFLPFASAGR